MKPEFYWINRVNLVEYGGPFETIKEVIADVEKTQRAIKDIALEIAIMSVIGEGTVNKQYKFKWNEE